MIDFDHPATWFRDVVQRDAVRSIIRDHLADDRQQEECRFLMKLWWHLAVDYGEVTWDELEANVGDEKLAVLRQLLRSIESGFDHIDEWIEKHANS